MEIRDLILVKLVEIFTKILYSHVCSEADQHIYEPKYICEQNWVKLPSFLRHGVHRDFGMHKLMHVLNHLLMDGQM